ncbi:MAG: Methyltransferase domain protein [Methanocella sp. PtaU1.Bin125]|nr:MAG: Methyltransferase domain protein [Methanocella sp. PtaU1.Bin125]
MSGTGKARLSLTEAPLKDMVKNLRAVANGFETGQAFYTALELGVFDSLRTEKSAAELAAEVGTIPDMTARLLDLLAGLGLLEKNGNRYAVRDEYVPFLVEGEPYYASYLRYSLDRRHYWMNLGEILKNGPSPGMNAPGYDSGPGPGAVEHMARNAVLGRLQATLKIVSMLPEFRSARRMIDLGGGHGLFGIGFAQENLSLEVDVFDRPGVTDVASRYIDEYGLQDRVRTITGDYNADSLGAGYDVALDICSFGGSRPGAKAFYEKVAGCLNEGGLFVKSTFTLDDDRKGPPLTLMFDLEEHITGHGHFHVTNQELFEQFAAAGLCGEKVIDLSPFVDVPMRLIIAKKVCEETLDRGEPWRSADG